MRPNQSPAASSNPVERTRTYSNTCRSSTFEYLSSWAAKVAKIVGDCRGSSAATGFGGGRVVTEERVRYADLVPYEVPDFPGVVEGPARWFAEVAAASVVCPGPTFDLAAAASCSPLVERSSAKAGPATRRSSWTSLADDVHRIGVRRDRHPVSAGPRDSPPRSAAAAARLMAEVTTSK